MCLYLLLTRNIWNKQCEANFIRDHRDEQMKNVRETFENGVLYRDLIREPGI